MIPIFPCDSRRSKVPSGSAVFIRLLIGELGLPNLPKFSPIPNGYTHTECYYYRCGPKMSEKAQFYERMYFCTKYLRPYPQYSPKRHFGDLTNSNAKPIIERPLSKSHANGATKLKVYSYIGIGKYVGCVQFFPLGGVRGAQGPLM